MGWCVSHTPVHKPGNCIEEWSRPLGCRVAFYHMHIDTHTSTHTEKEVPKEIRVYSSSVHGNGWVEWGQTRELHRGMVETFGS